MKLAPLFPALCAIALAPTAAPVGAAQPEPAAAPAPAVRSAPPQLGRLFFSPAERAQLDVARLQKKPTQSSAPELAEAAPAPQIVTYGGIVRRSDGRQMLWLNNRLVDEKEALASSGLKGRVRADGSVTLQAPSGQTIDVKVGQSVELQTGRIAEARKPPLEAPKPASEAAGEAKAAEAKTPAADAKASARSAAPDSAEKKPPPGGFGLKMDLGSRTLGTEEAERVSRK